MAKYGFTVWGVVCYFSGFVFCACSTGAFEEAQTAVSKVQDYRAQVCSLPVAVPSSVPGMAEVGEACSRGDDFDAVVKAYACADSARDGNVEVARSLEPARVIFCSVVEDPKLDSPEVDAVRDACKLNRNLREMAKAYVGGCG